MLPACHVFHMGVPCRFDAQTAVANQYLKGEDGGPDYTNTFREELMLPTADAFHMYSRERAPRAGQLLLGNVSQALVAENPPLVAPKKKRFVFF